MNFNETKKYEEAIQYRDWQTCDLIAEEHGELVETIKSLEQKLAIAVDALEFIESGCLVLPDGGSPELADAIISAREALEKIKPNLT